VLSKRESYLNLLGPLTGYPDLIKQSLPPGHRGIKQCETMLEAVQIMAEINDDMLTLAKGGQGDEVGIELNRLVEQALGG